MIKNIFFVTNIVTQVLLAAALFVVLFVPLSVVQADHEAFCAGLSDSDCGAALVIEGQRCSTLTGVPQQECTTAYILALNHLNNPDPSDDDDDITDPGDDDITPPNDDDDITPPNDDGDITPPNDDGDITPPNDSLFTFTWGNPSRFDSFAGIVEGILQTLVTISIPIIVLMFIFAGFLYVTARGNAEQVKKATTALVYAVIGAVLILGAAAVAGIMRETLCEFRPAGSAGCPVSVESEVTSLSEHV